ncbi:hypothetical protein NBH00_21625 [Paraconexibacter antarcticus]|uniref:Uncharacterized protein n=1 Tax=Paraconexibacter antarcticus TaxID=2949664 RepID=A0ABY5DTC1_9ACTN|nr:hypothetical protein [Paraconexibacter antarcticus]UTI63930.1 hypothetical protein NBH00_21625 [Paraconexibacter antarcticus]
MPQLPEVVRSYQRVFRPDRRIYAIDGKTLPIPGGIPIRWLGTATLVLVAGMLLAAVKPVVVLAAAGIVGAGVWRLGRHRPAVIAAAAAAAGCVVVGVMLRSLDWPLRLIVIPSVAATAALQLAPDGRSAYRFPLSWARAQVAGRRRLGQPLRPSAAPAPVVPTRLVVASDEHAPRLTRGRVSGPATLRFAGPVALRRGRRGRCTIRPLASGRRRTGVILDEVRLAEGEHAQVRP